jgi:aspartyl-tRNA(Asn)/glutamyl-tRNA(Gln) amidotransferase subunit A
VENYKDLKTIQKDLKEGKLSLPALVSHYLDVIKKGQDLNIFLEVWEEEALAKAKEIQEKLNAGTAGRLAGAVIGVKDNICLKGHKVSASSKILGGFESIYTATSLERLLAEDAILIGRTNCDEFAMGSSNENSAYGVVKNPLDVTRVPGGSSGGSAAAVAAGMCLMALGSDTGGSIRQPASFCGLVGLKPTYGRISRYGLIAYASSFDQIGPFSNTIEDAALLYEIMAGKDEMDATSSSEKVTAFTGPEKEPLRIAYIQDCLESEGMSDGVKKAFNQEIQDLKAKGHTVEPVSFPLLDSMIPAYYVLTTAEASSNLARFDGIHFGYRSKEAKDIESTYVLSRSEGFGMEVQRRIMLGTFVLSAGYYDAYYSKAQKVRRLIKEKTEEILKDYDLIMTPSCPSVAFPIDSVKDPIAMYLQDIFTVQANLTGMPAITLPLTTADDGLPLGIHFLAAPFKEELLFDIGARCMHEMA